MTTSLLPEWKEALRQFIESDPKPGMIIKQEWLRQVFGIVKPVTAQEQKEADFKFLQFMTEFRSELLENHCIALRTIQGVGYEVVHPKEQTKWALENGVARIGREIGKMARNVMYVNVNELNETERREHTDGMSKVAQIQSMFNRRKLLGRI